MEDEIKVLTIGEKTPDFEMDVYFTKWEPGKKTLTPGKDLVGKVGEQLS